MFCNERLQRSLKEAMNEIYRGHKFKYNLINIFMRINLVFFYNAHNLPCIIDVEHLYQFNQNIAESVEKNKIY